jgi:hypothetical protein
MESILKSDVFFFVTTIAVFLVTAILIMILSEVLRIMQNIRLITDKFRKEADALVSDFGLLRATLHNNQFGLKPIFDGIKKATSAFSKNGQQKRKKKKASVFEESAINSEESKESGFI